MLEGEKTMDMKNVTGAITALGKSHLMLREMLILRHLSTLLDFQIEQGIDGILALGTDWRVLNHDRRGGH